MICMPVSIVAPLPNLVNRKMRSRTNSTALCTGASFGCTGQPPLADAINAVIWLPRDCQLQHGDASLRDAVFRNWLA